MIFGLAAFLVSIAAQPASAALAADKLPEIFTAACLDGSVGLSPGQASKISFGELPESLRDKLGNPTGGQVFRLNSTGRAYLYVLDYEPRPINSPKICGLAAEEMAFGPARRLLESRVDANPVRLNSVGNRQWLQAEEGYVATATTAAEFNVLQIRWLSDEQQRRALFELRQMGADVPKSPKRRD